MDTSTSIDRGTVLVPQPRTRLIEFDVLRGFLLLWMTITHLPTKASIISNQTFGFISAAEGFIFLAAFMMGQLTSRMEAKEGRLTALWDLLRRTARIYLYHCAIVAVTFTFGAFIAVSLHREALLNLLDYYLQKPREAGIAAAVLVYRPSLMDILPMYIVFLLLTPFARIIARRWSWKPVICVSAVLWTAAQFGLRGWLYGRGDIFGLSVPQRATGAFDVYGWQFLWVAGLALGTIAAARKRMVKIPRGLLVASYIIAVTFLVLRYIPADYWMSTDVYGRLIDKWSLGPIRLLNFSAIAIVLVRLGARLAALPFLTPLAALGRASLQVFSAHVLLCLGGLALSADADPNLPWWQQVLLLIVTISALFFTAKFSRNARATLSTQKFHGSCDPTARKEPEIPVSARLSRC